MKKKTKRVLDALTLRVTKLEQRQYPTPRGLVQASEILRENEMGSGKGAPLEAASTFADEPFVGLDEDLTEQRELRKAMLTLVLKHPLRGKP